MPQRLPLINDELDQAEHKAWKALSRYKFLMAGYHAAQWVMLNRVSGAGRPNPFRPLVQFAREHLGEAEALANQGANFPNEP